MAKGMEQGAKGMEQIARGEMWDAGYSIAEFRFRIEKISVNENCRGKVAGRELRDLLE